MKKLINVILVTILLTVMSDARAADWLNWSNFSKVTGMVRQGSNIWIAGHGGVVKIDTLTQQKTYYIKTAGQLPSLMVEDITMDAISGDIWIGTYDNGMVQVHNGQWILHPYPTSVTLYHFAMAGNGTLWCATSAGLYKFANQVFTPVNNPNTSASWDVKIFPNGKLLVAGHQPVVYDPVLDTTFIPNVTVFGYNTSVIAIDNDSSYYFTGEAMGISHIVDTAVYFINDSAIVDMQLSDEVIQMTMVNNQLTVLTRNSKAFQYSGGNWTGGSINTNAMAVSATNICQLDGQTWLGGSFNGGIVRRLTGTTVDISLKKFALSGDQVSAIHDRNGTETWVMAGNEIGLYNNNSHTFSEVDVLPIIPSSVGDMAEWNGNTVAVTDSGLFQYNGTAWVPLSISGLPAISLISLASDSSGNLYVGSQSGLYIIHGTTATVYNSANTTALNNNDLIRKAYFDAERNTMWFATAHGIVKLVNGTFTLINAVNYPQISYYAYIASIAQDASGDMWFGTAYGGLIRYDGNTYTLDSVGGSAGNQTVTALAFDGSTLYAANDVYGLWVRDNGIWTNYNTGNSDMTSDYVTGLHVDELHNVWLTSLDYGTMDAFGIDIFNKTQVTLSIKETSTNSMKVYPNPTTGRLFINSENMHEGDQLTLTDALGRQVGTFQISRNEINIGEISRGVYFLRMADQAAPSVRIVKE